MVAKIDIPLVEGPAQPYVRLVPSGMRKLDDKDYELRASLLFSPVPADGGSWRLSNWPANVAGLLKGLTGKIEFRLAVHQPGQEGCVVPDPASSTVLEVIRFGEKDDLPKTFFKKAGRLSDLWQTAIVPDRWEGAALSARDKAAVWSSLLGLIEASLSGQRTQTGAIGDGSAAGSALEDEAFGDMGQLLDGPARDRRKVDTILSIPYAEAAVALDHRRTDGMIGSMVQAFGQEKPRPEPAGASPFPREAAVAELVGAELRAAIAKADISQIAATPQVFAVIGASTGFAATQENVTAHPIPENFLPLPAQDATPDPEAKDVRDLQVFDRAVLWKAAELGALDSAAATGPGTLRPHREQYAKALAAARDANLKAMRKKSKIARHKYLSETGLEAQRKQAAKIFSDTKAGLENDSPVQVCAYTSCAPEELEEATRQAEQIDAATQAAEYGHWPQYANSDERKPTPKQRALQDCAAQAYFSIEGNPTLARAFGLAIDVYLRIPAKDLPQEARFGIVSAHVDIGQGLKQPQPWTLTKFRTGADGCAHGWPVTMAEYQLARQDGQGQIAGDQSHCVGQYDGFVVMGGTNAGWAEGADPRCTLPRYDLTTMDVRAALDAEDQRMRAIRAEAETPARGRAASAAARAQTETGPDYQSLGIALLCRSAQADAVRRLAAVQQKCGAEGACVRSCDGASYVIHDAEDVTNGFRLLIGMPRGGETGDAWKTQWRPLTARAVRYGRTPGDGGDDVEDVLKAAVGRAGSDARIALESAFQALPSRDLKGAAADRVETVVEETVAIWDGSPGGVDCSTARGQEKSEMEDIMPFGRVNSVPTGKSKFKVFPLRNGLPYRVAMAASFAGGRSIDPNLAPCEHAVASNAADNAALRNRLFYPSAALVQTDDADDAKPYVRALRQARVGAPSVMIAQGHAEKRNTPMGYEQSGKMVVRSLRDADTPSSDIRVTSRGRPALSQRLLLVPSLPQALAARHLQGGGTLKAVFDDCDKRRAPDGAHNLLDYSNTRGFPAIKTSTRPGFNGEPYVHSRSIVKSAKNRVAGEDEIVSDLVYKRTDRVRHTTYYPDPAADLMVVRARRANDDGKRRRVLGGKTIAVPVAKAYPDSATVLFSLKARDRRKGGANPQQGDIVKYLGEVSLDPSRSGDIEVAQTRLKAQRVELHLEPGDQFEIESWFVPSAWRLAHDFAVVQAFAQRLDRVLKAAQAPTLEAVELALRQFKLPVQLAPMVLPLWSKPRAGVRYVGPAGVLLPESGFIRDVAQVIHDFMCDHPVAEISGLRTITAIHAVNVPAQENRPLTKGIGKQVEPFPDPDCDMIRDPEVLRAVRPTELGQAVPGFSDALAIAEGASTAVLKGAVQLNRERIDAIEVIARMVSPESEVFDDLHRGRSLARRIAGTWPRPLGGDTGFRQASDIFGFRLSPDGRVTLPEATVTLLRIDGLPYPEENGVRPLYLDDYFLERHAPEQGATSQRHVFPDGKARRMQVWVNGLARTAEHMTTDARVIRGKDPWLKGSGLVYEVGELAPAEPLPPDQMRRLSPPVEVILPATQRPAMPDARAPVPVFDSETRVEQVGEVRILTHLRRARTRIPLGRGWFSSGVDERLGIVLWPPDQLLSDAASIARNLIPLHPDQDCTTGIGPGGFARGQGAAGALPQGSEPRIADLPFFVDEDLGPGGRYVTRRGADPMRRADGASDQDETQVFLARDAFLDLQAAPEAAGRAEFVPRAEMPLAEKNDAANDDEEQAEAADAAEPEAAAQPPLAVALVTYQPRFDPEREEWYADVALKPGKSADPFVRFGLVRYQPHTRADLRCSQPVTQWVQTLPDRCVEVIRSPGSADVRVRISGPMSRGRAFEGSDKNEALRDFLAQQKARAVPFMRVTAFVEGENSAGVKTRDTVALRDPSALLGPYSDQRGETLELRPSDGVKGEGVWTARIPQELIDTPGAKLLIEEIEYFLPADFDDEPMTLDRLKDFDESLWRETGPRFAAHIDLAMLAKSKVT